MNKLQITKLRLYNQLITQPIGSSPQEVVKWMGAMQAQDYAMAKWAVGLRLKKATDQLVQEALDNADIIRTHILRPTWHLVAPEDVHWMLELSLPNIRKLTLSSYRKLKLDHVVFKKSHQLILKELEGENHKTRAELLEMLGRNNIQTDYLRGSHLLFQAELDGLICNGVRKGKQNTYALLDERVPVRSNHFSKKEALTLLAQRYFRSHGPATVYDFAWWSGFTLTEAKLTMEEIKSDFITETIEDKTYWFSEPADTISTSPAIHLLPAFDEFLISYKERTASISKGLLKEVMTNNGLFKPVLVENGQIRGRWKPVVKKIKNQDIGLEVQLFDQLYKLPVSELDRSIKKYKSFFINA